ncbi:MAG: hypothetical protein H0T11_05265 [Chthoniobacterales bacterium]|nr:hypothetical protein [Chthoniobacterales bacterium]
MKLRFLCAFSVALTLAGVRAQEADNEVEARRVALELAGAFSNDGFKIRDGHWAGEVKNDSPAVIAVNLYAGNQYWFSVGSNEKDAKFSVTLNDETGQPVPADDYHGEATAAAGFSPTTSGQYFVSISPSDPAAGTFCLVYSYK